MSDALRIFLFRVDWSKLYEKDYYTNQDVIYQQRRPKALSNSLVIPMQKIREHIRELTLNEHSGLKTQIEALHPSTDGRRTDESAQQSSLMPVDPINHLQTYTIEVVCNIFGFSRRAFPSRR